MEKATSDIVVKPLSFSEQLREHRSKKEQQDRHKLDGWRLYQPQSTECADAVKAIEEIMEKNPLLTHLAFSFRRDGILMGSRCGKYDETTSTNLTKFPWYPSKDDFPTSMRPRDGFVEQFFLDACRDIAVEFLHKHPDFRLMRDYDRELSFPCVSLDGSTLRFAW